VYTVFVCRITGLWTNCNNYGFIPRNCPWNFKGKFANLIMRELKDLNMKASIIMGVRLSLFFDYKTFVQRGVHLV